MFKLLKTLRVLGEVVTTVGAVLAAAVIAVETYQALRKKIDSRETSRPD